MNNTSELGPGTLRVILEDGQEALVAVVTHTPNMTYKALSAQEAPHASV